MSIIPKALCVPMSWLRKLVLNGECSTEFQILSRGFTYLSTQDTHLAPSMHVVPS